MILLSHPTANQNVRQTALALAEAGLLAEFWTCINWQENGAFDQLLSMTPRIRNELRRRSFARELQPFIKTSPGREWGRQFSGQFGLRFLTGNESGAFSMDAVYHSLDRQVAKRLSSLPSLKAVYAYDGGALETFRAAKKLGLKCVYEHPIVYWRKVRQLQREEAERQPEWAPTFLGLRDSDEKLARKDEELALADYIITPGKFSSESLALAPNLKAQLKVIPYGAPPVVSKTESKHGDRLRVLFVGALSQAKGLGYLLESVARFGSQVELTLIGHRVAADVPPQQLIDRHRWIQSLPHDQLLEEMSRHDLLVFPSLHEGFGLVILEAMAQGIPVIATPNTGGADVIADGIDGFIVPIRSSDAIAEKLQLLQRDRPKLEAMKEAARGKAEARSWQTYRRHLVALAQELIAN